MGGLGKTTLAQLVLSRAKSGFDFTAWGKDLNSLQEQLKEKLSRKKFLIVLDDVWNENYEKWVLCRAPLESGSSGSKIVITTRNASVASIMGTDPPYHLKELAFNGCLSLFAEHGLIVEKCRGLPLAVKVMGGLLRGKQDPRLWEEVLNSKIWEFPESNGILPALRVSYYHLPSHLKQCFAYCGILPNEELMLMNCPKVRRLPKKGLPASLGSLKLNACPGLKKRCLEQKGEYWPLMQQIPCVEIDSIESSSYSCQEP
ncbi:Putative disease resistance protein RGA4 [Linum perenne]